MGFLEAFWADLQFAEMGGHLSLLLGGHSFYCILRSFFLC